MGKKNIRNTWIDTHAHFQTNAFEKNDIRKETMKELFKFNPRRNVIDRVQYVVNAAIDYNSNEQQLKMIKKSRYRKHMYMVCGIHPNSVDMDLSLDDQKYNELRYKYLMHKRCVGIGETGLDYKRVRRLIKGGNIDYEYMEKMVPRQVEWFRRSISLSLETGLPLILHIRNSDDFVKNLPHEKYADAYKDAIAILSECFDETDTEIRGICHSFNGSREQMEKLIRLGFYIGVNGMATRPECEYLRGCIEDCPINRIVVETDSPYLAPYTKEGEMTDRNNTPLTIPLIGQWIADIKGMPVSEVQRITTENAVRAFGL